MIPVFRFLRLPLTGAVVCALASGCCAHDQRRGPEAITVAYADALDEGRLDDAYALTSADYRAQVTRSEFGKRYAKAEVRKARAAELLSVRVHATAGETSLVLEEGQWRVGSEGQSDDGARSALEGFVSSVEKGDFAKAYALLSGDWRARYTPERFKADFQASPENRDRLSRAKAALNGSPEHVGNEVRFNIGDGRAVRLVREGDGYRVAAIE